MVRVMWYKVKTDTIMRLYILRTSNECMSEWKKGKDTREEKGNEEVI